MAYDGLGLLRYDAGEPDAAAEWFQRAIEVEPRYAPGHGHLGWVRYAKREWSAAAGSFERAIDLGSKAVDYRYLLGFSLAYAGDCGRARPWFEQAQALDPESQPARDGLALCP